MKLADQLKSGGIAEITTTFGEKILLGGTGETHKLEKVDDAEQTLSLLTLLSTGRQKGKKARVVLPYSSIGNVTVLI